MPRGHKSKLRVQAKRRQARSENQPVQDAQAPGAQGGEAPSCSGLSEEAAPSSSVGLGPQKLEEAASSSSVGLIPQKSEEAGPSSSVGLIPQKSEEAAPSSSMGLVAQKSEEAAPSSSVGLVPQKVEAAPSHATQAGAPSQKRSGKGAKGKKPERAASSKAMPSTESLVKDLHRKKAGMLMHYLLYRYKIKEPILKGEMLRIIHKRFRPEYPEILKTAADRVELLFGLELVEVKPGGGSYALVTKVDSPNSAIAFTGLSFPVNGLLMPLLGVIFLNGNSATEEVIWKFLSALDMYDGTEHLIFGEPRNLITKDLVKLGYLVYRRVRHSDPPSYEFLWGPRAYAETSKMKVLEFLAKVNETIPSAFPVHYAEALREEEEWAKEKAAARRGPTSPLP
ncbi:melanoma-associated antigen B2-like [Octodon degus]|uniref:Melanoma-associated antigen B2-like n=1 Tax=Octodon degus TaxID=10160 RepID=A0A6P3ETP3_OCTDE|nr:melanoma-associated antigen B2-like [Octodon degus]